jgi:hypothetical protein
MWCPRTLTIRRGARTAVTFWYRNCWPVAARYSGFVRDLFYGAALIVAVSVSMLARRRAAGS